MSLLTRKRIILAKTESTYGVDPTPSGAANAIQLRSLNVNPFNGELVQRDLIRGYLGNSDTLNASTHVTLDFEVEATGSGTAGTAPLLAPLLKACALGETVSAGVSVTYAPISDAFSSCTIYFQADSVLHKITGARGTFSLSISARQIPVFKFSFTGMYNAPTDSAAPTAVYSGFQNPKIANTANTTGVSIFGYTPILSSFDFTLGNQINHREYIGEKVVDITQRAASGSALIQAPTIAAKDFWTASQTSTTGAVAITHGSAGNEFQFNAARVSLGNPSYSDDNGVEMLSLPLTIAPTSGNDDFSLAFL